MQRWLLVVALAAPSVALRISHDVTSEYFWPSGHGKNGGYGHSIFTGPQNLQDSFAWSWHHPRGRFNTLPYGTAIDGKKNIYLTTDTSIWKVNMEGTVMWSFTPTPKAAIFGTGTLYNGSMFFSTVNGYIYSLDMETGKKVWSQRVCNKSNYDNRFVSASEGVVVTATDKGSGADEVVRAMRATDGETVWTYRPQAGLWNFMAMFPGDGTVLYQDYEGRGYRHNITDGKLLWKAGGEPGSWTDGSALYYDGLLYTVSAFMTKPEGDGEDAPGRLRAYRLEDGELVWSVNVHMPPNNAPAVGKMPGRTGLTIVQPAGYQGKKHLPTAIYTFDAKTGEAQWNYTGPVQAHERQAGEQQGMVSRLVAGATPGYVTNPWSAPIVDGNGTLYLGHEDGLFFAIHDNNADGKISDDEVSKFDTGAAFVGSSSPAMAPGMLAVANCDTLYVFHNPLVLVR